MTEEEKRYDRSAKSKAYYQKNKEKIKGQMKVWREKNKEWRKEYRTQDYVRARERERAKGRKEYQKEYQRNRRAKDPLFRLSAVLRSGVANSLRRGCIKKGSRTESAIGCSYDEFITYIESRWEPWMNWDNYGKYNGQPNHGWDLDHIIHLSTAITEDDMMRLYHWTNYRPLCSYTNRYIKIAEPQ